MFYYFQQEIDKCFDDFFFVIRKRKKFPPPISSQTLARNPYPSYISRRGPLLLQTQHQKKREYVMIYINASPLEFILLRLAGTVSSLIFD